MLCYFSKDLIYLFISERQEQQMANVDWCCIRKSLEEFDLFFRLSIQQRGDKHICQCDWRLNHRASVNVFIIIFGDISHPIEVLCHLNDNGVIF